MSLRHLIDPLDFSRQEVEELLRESITGTRSALSIVNPKGV